MRPSRILAFSCLLASAASGALTNNMEATATVRSTAISGNVQIPTGVFYAVGATAGDANDDRAAIQGALDAAEAAGGGIVQLGAGEYKVIVVYDATTTFDGGAKTKGDGHYGLEIPAGVTLQGLGMTVTTIKSYVGTNNNDTGGLIYPKGFRSADVAYECGGFTLRDLKLIAAATSTDSTEQETCILLGAVHGDGIRCERVFFGTVTAHMIEIDYNRGLTCSDCVFDGALPFGASGSWIQFDAGDNGPGSSHLTKSQAPNINNRFDRCVFKQRPNTDLSAKDVDLNHGDNYQYNTTFRECIFYGRQVSASTGIIAADSSATTAITDGFNILDCSFYVYSSAAAEVNDNALLFVPGVGSAINNLRIEGCRFYGTANYMISGGNGTLTTAQRQKQRGWSVRNNRIEQVLAASSGNEGGIRLVGLEEATIADNQVIFTGTGGGTSIGYLHDNTSGSIYNNTHDLRGTAVAEWGFQATCASAEVAAVSGAITGFRLNMFGNLSYASGTLANSHYYCVGDAATTDAPTFSVRMSNNVVQGTSGAAAHLYQYLQFNGGATSTYGSSGEGQLLQGLVLWNGANMTTGTEATFTITVNGARPGGTTADVPNAVTLGWQGSITAGIVVCQAWVSAENTVSVRVRNATAGDVDPGGVYVRAVVRQL